jgi:2-polyprenyl-3-methyl-5-hydroxy-6-metoxy-1,4-benzoquinol methylase
MLKYPQAQFSERRRCINCGSAHLIELSRGKFTDQPLIGFIEADPWGESPIPYLQNAEWILNQCSGCEQVFHKRILTDEWNEKRFSTWMSAEAIHEFEVRASVTLSFAARKFESARQHVAHILRIEKLTRSIRKSDDPVRLLDFGCGWGEFLIACKLFGFEACGVDRATPRIDGAIAPIFTSLDDLRNRPVFHTITLFEVLEHLDDPASILKQLSRILARGGLLVLETPDCANVTDIRSRQDYLKVHPLDHINAFTHTTLKSIAKRHGFDAISRVAAHVTADRKRAIKTEAKHLLGRDGKSTQMYFRKA